MERQRDQAVAVARSANLRDARILDAGCGTGWLGNALLPFGEVWGIDLSEAAVAEGRRRHPGLKLVRGDVLAVELPAEFDLVVSADSLIHMHDQERFVRRVATLLKPGGTFLLMTQNRGVWRRKSTLKPLESGQVQRWLSVRQYLRLLGPFFTVERVTSLAPGGDRGVLWWVENRYVPRTRTLAVSARTRADRA
jgi:2-polyprenyl-3-methyl-5-hydroxy-6-metoxy-1,4-benzoquinol methylase